MSKNNSKDSNRIKGNLKVSKSDRAAMFLLENQGYIGSSSKLLGFVPIDFDLDSEKIDDNLRPILRRMEKKDSITKIKAYEELTAAILSDSLTNDEALLSILPYYPRLYSRAAIETDQKLREAAHRSIHAYTKRLGKKTQSELKSYFPVWYFGRFDSHKPTSNVCNSGIYDIFPDKKLLEVIKYSQKELFSFLDGRLTVCQNTMSKEPDNVPLFGNCFKFFVDIYHHLKDTQLIVDLYNYFDKTHKLWLCFKGCRDTQVMGSCFMLISQILNDSKTIDHLINERKDFLIFLLKHSILRIGTGSGERNMSYLNTNEHWFLSIKLVQALSNTTVLSETVNFVFILERIYSFLNGDDLLIMSGALNNILALINTLNFAKDQYENQMIILFIDLPLGKIMKSTTFDPLMSQYLCSLMECGRYVSLKTVEANSDKFINAFIDEFFSPAFDKTIRSTEKSISSQKSIFDQICSFLSFLEKKQTNPYFHNSYNNLLSKIEESSFKDEVLSKFKDNLIDFCKAIIDNNKNLSESSLTNGNQWKKMYLQKVSNYFQSNDGQISSLNHFFSIYYYLDNTNNETINYDDAKKKIKEFLSVPIERNDVTALFGWLKLVHHQRFPLSELTYSTLTMLFDTTFQTLACIAEIERQFIDSLAYFTIECFSATTKVIHIRNAFVHNFLHSLANNCPWAKTSHQSDQQSKDFIVAFKRSLMIKILYSAENFEVIHYMSKYCLNDLEMIFKSDELELFRKSLIKYLASLVNHGDSMILKYTDQLKAVISDNNLNDHITFYKRSNYPFQIRIHDTCTAIKQICNGGYFESDCFPILIKGIMSMNQSLYLDLERHLFDLAEGYMSNLQISSQRLKVTWLNHFSTELVTFSDYLEETSIVTNWNSRLLLSNYGLPTSCHIIKLTNLLRLLLLYQRICPSNEKFDNDDDNERFICCLGILRAWLNMLTVINDGITPELSYLLNNRQQESIVCVVNRLWYRYTSTYSLDNLLGMMKKFHDLSSHKSCEFAWSTTMLVRFLHRVPSEWPLDCKGSFPTISCYNENISLEQLTSIIIPSGLFWKYSSKMNILKELEACFESFSPLRLSIILNSFASIRGAASSYSTIILPLIFLNKKNKPKSSLFDEITSVNMDEFTPDHYQVLISCQRIIETSFLLWQPWQWLDWSKTTTDSLTNSDKINMTNILGFRLRQYRPRLSKDQWESIMYNMVCWVIKSTKVELIPSTSSKQEEHQLASSTFRCLASLGALFLEPATLPSLWLDEVLINDPKKKIFSLLNDDGDEDKSRNLVHANFDFNDNDESDSDDNLSDLEAAIEAISDDEDEEQTKKSPSKNTRKEDEEETTKKIFNFDDSNDEIDDECELPSDHDDEFTGGGKNKASSKLNIPKRIRPPMHARKDWSSFFVGNIYPPLIHSLLKACLPIETGPTCPSLVIKSLCAALGTCPIGTFYSTIKADMGLFKNHITYNSIFHHNSSAYTNPDNIQFLNNNDNEDLQAKYKRNLDIDLLVNFGAVLISRSKHLAGQMLGHNILTRLISSISISGKRFSEYLLVNMSRILLANLAGNFDGDLTNKLHLHDDESIINWGRNCGFIRWTEDEHSQLIGYLFSWDCIISMFTSSRPRVRSKLQACLMNEKMIVYLDKFLVVLGRLLESPSKMERLITRPANLDIDLRLLASHSFRTKSLFNLNGLFTRGFGKKSAKIKHILEYTNTDDIDWIDQLNNADRLVEWPNERITSEIKHFAVHLFKRILGESPSLIRSWVIELQSKVTNNDSKISPFFNKTGQAKQLAGHFGKFVEKFLSNIIIRESIFSIQQRADKAGLLKKQRKNNDGKPAGLMSFLHDDSDQQPEGTITIQPNLATKEVLTCYQADAEHGVELIIKFPDNYPISSVEVTHGKKVGVSRHQWKAWLNGSILDGIELWLRNIKKKFDGVEECVICTSIIHNKNFSMPRMQCRVCKKKFHQDCLYRWYASSNNPTCPMCRSLLTVN